jgi:glycerol-3-phosphate cytidylyltransferase-like family protein
VLPRTVVIALAVVLGLQTAVLADKDFNKAWRDAYNHQRRRKYSEAVKACDKILKDFKEDWQIQKVTRLKIDNLTLADNYETALKEIKGLAKKYPDNEELQREMMMRTGDTLRKLERFDDAIATYRKLAKTKADIAPTDAAEALLRVGHVYSENLKKPKDAIAVYREIEAKFGKQDRQRTAAAIHRTAEILRVHTKELEKAAAEYQKLTTVYADIYDQNSLSGFHTKIIDCLVGAEKHTEALAAAKTAEQKLSVPTTSAQYSLRRADLLLDMKKPAEARAECVHLICTYPLDENACHEAQKRVVTSYRAEGRWGDALGAARSLYDAAGSQQHIQSAAQVVARCFLAVDGNLNRANEFLQYQRFGPNGPDGKPKTKDDISANHLTSAKYPEKSKEINKTFQDAIAKLGKSRSDYRAKGFIYLYWGKPTEGAKQFYEAFKAAPLDKIPEAAQELAIIGIKARTASFYGLDKVFEYINHGPGGKEGKKKLQPFKDL